MASHALMEPSRCGAAGVQSWRSAGGSAGGQGFNMCLEMKKFSNAGILYVETQTPGVLKRDLVGQEGGLVELALGFLEPVEQA